LQSSIQDLSVSVLKKFKYYAFVHLLTKNVYCFKYKTCLEIEFFNQFSSGKSFFPDVETIGFLSGKEPFPDEN